jgi:hypothetical protein
MAKYKHFRSRGGFRGFKKSRHHSGVSSGITPTNMALAGAVYGVGRPFVANLLPSMFNLGGVDSDNVLLGVGGWLLASKSKGLLKAIGLMALGTEVGYVTGKMIGGTPASTSTQYTSMGYTFV